MATATIPDGFTAVKIDPHTTNQTLPLTCGHKHHTGMTVYISADKQTVLCSRHLDEVR